MEGYATCTITHAVSGGGITEEASTVLLEELTTRDLPCQQSRKGKLFKYKYCK